MQGTRNPEEGVGLNGMSQRRRIKTTPQVNVFHQPIQAKAYHFLYIIWIMSGYMSQGKDSPNKNNSKKIHLNSLSPLNKNEPQFAM